MSPYFSIIIPTYNRAGMLPVAIESVINQTFKDWELLIIDDGSTDNTAEVVRSYTDERIKYFFQENQERCAARNNGIERSKGKYICFLDSDDYFLEDRFEKLNIKIKELGEPNLFMFTGVCFEKNDKISQRAENPVNEHTNKYDYFMRSHIHCQQTIIPREILLNNKFDLRFNISEDTELWLRIITKNNFLYIDNQHTVVVTDHDDRSISVSKNNVYAKVLVVFSYMRKQFNYPFSKELIKYYYCDGNFGIAKYYIYQSKRFTAAKHMLLSIFYDIKNKQLKYRLNILLNIFFDLKKAESLIK